MAAPRRQHRCLVFRDGLCTECGGHELIGLPLGKTVWHLLIRAEHARRWIREYSSYEKSAVLAAFTAHRDEGVRVSDLGIVASGDAPHEISSAIAGVNR